MRVVVAAMGGLVPELALMARELCRRFDTLVLVGHGNPEATAIRCRAPDARFEPWSVVASVDELQGKLEGADVIVHVPARAEETPRDGHELRLRSVQHLFETVRRLRRSPHRIISVLSNGESTETTALPRPAEVALCTARIGLVLRAPESSLVSMLCALRVQLGVWETAHDAPVSWIHELDGVRALAHIVAGERIGEQLDIASPSSVSAETFACSLWEAFGLPSKLRTPATMTFGRFLTPVRITGAQTSAEPLIQSGFPFLFPDLKSALADLHNK